MSWTAIRRNDSRARKSSSRGFSMIEVMVALVISGLVLVGVFAFSGVARSTTADFRRDVRIQQTLEGAIDAIGNDVRLAGLGFAQMCNEIRIYDPRVGRLINPSAASSGEIITGNLPRDADTGEPYWVLRDGFQAHWRSANSGTAANLLGDTNRPTSAAPGNHADSFDVILGEPGFVSAIGAFRTPGTGNVFPQPSGASARIPVQTSGTDTTALLNGDTFDLNSVRQLFPPGSFVLVIPSGAERAGVAGGGRGMRSCNLYQVTDDVFDDGGALGSAGPAFSIPISSISGFNANLAMLSSRAEGDAPSGASDADFTTWVPTEFEGQSDLLVVPLGRLRWSRYEIDYTVPARPYLVRRDIIGWVDGDPIDTPAIEYPGCGIEPGTGNARCQLPQLHSRIVGQGQDGAEPARTPIAPMVEDMQVAVGCDGFIQQNIDGTLPIPGYEETGARQGLPNDNIPNLRVDEWDAVDQRATDEWLGNALQEERAPDCVYWGTKMAHQANWVSNSLASENVNTGGFKMSPQTTRITLLGKVESEAAGSSRYAAGVTGTAANNFFNVVYSIEDRANVAPLAGAREYHTLTEQFHLRNVKYRDPASP